MSNITAAYSPEDNKLRLYSTTRLDSETYICANGPRQQAALKPLAEDSGGWWKGVASGHLRRAGN
jgi:hypothetical protein